MTLHRNGHHMEMTPLSQYRWRLPVAMAVWAALALTGMGGLWVYAKTPGPRAAAPAEWVGAAALNLDSAKATLVMFVHPHCECSRASVDELAGLMARRPGRVAARVVVYRPSDQAPGWERTELWARAERIRGAQVTSDPNGALALRFGALTSGHTFVYAPDGRLLFGGGLTIARGHAGDSPGLRAVERAVDGLRTPGSAPVFGCLIHASTDTLAGDIP